MFTVHRFASIALLTTSTTLAALHASSCGAPKPDACDDAGREASCGACELPTIDGTQRAIAEDDITALQVDVLRLRNGTFAAHMFSTEYPPGGIALATSSDGVTWSQLTTTVDERTVSGRAEEPFVFDNGAGYVLLMTNNTATGVQAATSIDVASWSLVGAAFAPSGVAGTDGGLLDDFGVHTPKVWFDGLRYHLYYTGISERVVDGVDHVVASIGHAVSDDGLAFSFVDWIAPSTRCPDGLPSTFEIAGFMRSSCAACELGEAIIVARGFRCGETEASTFVLRSADGTAFEAPEPIDVGSFDTGTILVGKTGAVAWSARNDVSVIDGVVDAMPFVSPGALCVRETVLPD